MKSRNPWNRKFSMAWILITASLVCSFSSRFTESHESTSVAPQNSLQQENGSEPEPKGRTVGQTNPLEKWTILTQLSKALAYQRSEDHEAAIKHLQKILNEHPGYWEVQPQSHAMLLTALASSYMARGDYAKAKEFFSRASASWVKIVGSRHPYYLDSQDNLAKTHILLAEYSEAESILQESLRIRKEVQLGVAVCLGKLALLYQSMGRYEEAEQLFQESRDKFEKTNGTRNINYVQLLGQLAVLKSEIGKFEEVEPLLNKAFEIEKSLPGQSRPLHSWLLNTRAVNSKRTGKYKEAEQLYTEVAEAVGLSHGKSHPEYASILRNLSELYMETGQFQEAEPLLQQVVDILATALGETHPDYAHAMLSLGNLHWHLGRYGDAEEALNAALNVFQERLNGSYAHAACLSRLSRVNYTLGRYDEFYSRSLQAMEIIESWPGKQHSLYAEILNNIAIHHSKEGRHTEAEKYMREATSIQEEALGSEHFYLARYLNNLASMLSLGEGYEEAEGLYRRAAAIQLRGMGDAHPEYAQTLQNLALLYAKNHRWDEAKQGFDASHRVMSRHVRRVLPGFSEPEQLSFLESKFQPSLFARLSFSLARPQDNFLQSLAASWILNGKGVTHETLAQRFLLAHSQSDPTTTSLWARLKEAQGRLAKLVYGGSKIDRQQYFARSQEATKEAQELSRDLGQAIGRRSVKEWIELAEIRQKLPLNSALVEIARLPLFDFESNAWKPAHYVAWVIHPPNREPGVDVVDLGDATLIEEAISDCRRTLNPIYSAAFKNASVRLAELVLRPIESLIEDYYIWFISPDDSLWLVPFEALPTRDGHYSLLSHRISYLSSGSDIQFFGQTGQKSGSAVVMANPDFDSDPSTDEANHSSDASSIVSTGKWQLLSYTAHEAKKVTVRLAEYLGIQPQIYLQREASEKRIKELSQPEVLVLSTHAFFNNVAPRQRQMGSLQQATLDIINGVPILPGEPVLENPLLRCGLALAGANLVLEQTASPVDDGILTGIEIVGTDLRNTELVVLSACDTGVGELRTGEGVAGLRHSFQLAGARSVVSTLWRIPESIETVYLIEDFFKNLTVGMGRAEALRRAQIKMLKSPPSPGGDHPAHWASFTLTGDPGSDLDPTMNEKRGNGASFE